MHPRLIQTPDMPPGTAALQCQGGTLDPQTVEFCLGQPMAGGGLHHLDPRDSDHRWGAAEFWQKPVKAEGGAGGMVLTLDSFTTWHLAPNKPYMLMLRDGMGRTAKAPVIGIALRLPSSPPQGWRDPAAVPAPAPEPEPEVIPEVIAAPVVVEPPAPPPVVLVADRPEPPPALVTEKKTPWGAIIGGILALWLVIGGGIYWYFFHDKLTADPPAAPPVAAAPDAPRTLAAARAALAAGLEAAAARTLGEAHLAAKDLDGAFLLFRAAAEKGDGGAAVAVGAFYDPGRWSKETSPLPAPNADQAATWYRGAADKGDAEAQYRLGMVLKSGKTEAADGPEQAVAWLKKAAEQGHAKAKEALGQ